MSIAGSEELGELRGRVRALEIIVEKMMGLIVDAQAKAMFAEALAREGRAPEAPQPMIQDLYNDPEYLSSIPGLGPEEVPIPREPITKRGEYYKKLRAVEKEVFEETPVTDINLG